MAADVRGEYDAGGTKRIGAAAADGAGSLAGTPGENLDALIDRARQDMERAAKSLDFLAAAKFRDRMYELQKLREENRR